MFDKPFEQLFRALHRIGNQLETAEPEEIEILREEIIALRSVCDRFVEKWILLEEKIADLSEVYGLEIQITETLPPVNQQNQIHAPFFLRKEQEQVIRLFRKGLGYFDLFMFPDAIREFENVVNQDGDFFVARIYLAYGYLEKGDVEKAEQQLSMVAAKAEEPFLLATIHNTYGYLYAAKEDFQKAAEQFKQAVEYIQDFRDVYFNLGICFYNLRQYNDAFSSFLLAVDQDPHDWQAELILASISYQLNRLEKAFEHIEKAYQVNSSNYEVLLLFADILFRLSEYGRAREFYNKACEYYPTSGSPLGGLGWLSVLEGNVDQAIVCFKKQLSLDPADWQAHCNLGWAFLIAEETEKANQIFDSLLSSSPDMTQAKIGMARIMRIQNKEKDAQTLLSSLTHSNEPHEQKLGYLFIGKQALEQGNYQLAAVQFNHAIQLDRQCLEGWFYKGLAHIGLGENDSAEECWSNCRQLRT